MKHTNRITNIFKGFVKKTVTTAIILMFVLILTKAASSQVNQQWVKTYNYLGAGLNNLTGMVCDGNGNIFVTGNSTGNSSGEDYCTVKYNSNGTQQWADRYSGFSDPFDSDYPIAITRDYPGNVYVTGRSRNGNFSYFDIATIKYNTAGDQVWVRRHTSTGNEEDAGYGIYVDNANNVYVTGHSNGHLIVIKYNSSGTELWKTIHNDIGEDESYGYDITGDGAGNIYAAGRSNDNGNENALLVKLSDAGAVLWQRTYSTANFDGFYKVKRDLAGNIIVSGNTGSEDLYDILIEKYNSDGELAWSKKYNNPTNGSDFSFDMVIDYTNNIYVTGSSSINGNFNYVTIKYDPAGTQLWLAGYDGDAGLSDGASAITIDGQGNTYVTGDIGKAGNNTDIATIKYNSAGVQQWVIKYDGPNLLVDRGECILLDNAGNIVVAGVTYSNNSTSFCTIKYTPLNGIQMLGGEIPGSYTLSQNYPNPFNPVTNINFSVPKSGFVRIAVYDIMGREVSVPVNENLQAGSYKYDFDASQLSSGTYFYKMTTNDFSEVKKMILVK